MENRNVVGVDPGKYNIVYMSDGVSKLRYTAKQRREETLLTRNQRIRLKLKKESPAIIEAESQLSNENSKTMDVERFKEYLREKNRVNAATFDFYEQPLHRKMKWRQYVYTQKSEDRFINRMRSLFGENPLVAYGDWNRKTQMRNFVPTKGVGMRRLISKHFQTFMVNEFRTSKLCCNCSKELSNYRVNHRGRNTKLYRCLVCEECKRSESKTRRINYTPNQNKRVFLTRDLNSALNIRNLAVEWIQNQSRPTPFCRTAPEETVEVETSG